MKGKPATRGSDQGQAPKPASRMEEAAPAPISVAGLTNFGNTCYANALLQALSSCPSLVDHVCVLYSATAAGMGRRAQGEAPLVHALFDALLRLQPRPGFQDLTGAASSLAVLHAMIARGYKAFCPMGAQQDVCEALEGVLSALQKETDSFLQGQRRPLTISSRLHCRIESIVACPAWNPALDVPIVRNTGRGRHTLTPDDMGDLQMRLSREQGPCNGLLAECLACECGYTYSTKFMAFAALNLPLPTMVEDGVERVRPGTCLQDCLRAFCASQKAEAPVCPRCSLRATVDGMTCKQDAFAVGGEQFSNSDKPSCEEPSQGPVQGWLGRILGWLGWAGGTEAKKSVSSWPSCNSVSSISSGHSKELAGILSDDSEVLSSNRSCPYLLSALSSRPSFSACSAVEVEPLVLDMCKTALDALHLEVPKSQCSLVSYGRPSTPITNFRESPTPSCTSSWGGWLGAYKANGVGWECNLPTSLFDAACKLRSQVGTDSIERDGLKKVAGSEKSLKADVTTVSETLRSDSGLDPKIAQLKGELEGVGVQWLDGGSMATTTIKIGRLPQVLPIYLNRETPTGGSLKVAGGLTVPLMLDMSDFVHMPQARGSFYHLVAMVIRVRDGDEGHYLTARRVFLSELDSTWFLASDEHVQQVAEEDVLCLQPSMLLYERDVSF